MHCARVLINKPTRAGNLPASCWFRLSANSNFSLKRNWNLRSAEQTGLHLFMAGANQMDSIASHLVYDGLHCLTVGNYVFTSLNTTSIPTPFCFEPIVPRGEWLAWPDHKGARLWLMSGYSPTTSAGPRTRHNEPLCDDYPRQEWRELCMLWIPACDGESKIEVTVQRGTWESYK
jgi:hypothetical protein